MEDQTVIQKNNIIKSIGPNYLWQVDLIGRIPDPNNTNKFIFVAIDHFTKWIETSVIEHKSSENALKLIEKLIVDKHGIPTNIWSDNGLEFQNEKV